MGMLLAASVGCAQGGADGGRDAGPRADGGPRLDGGAGGVTDGGGAATDAGAGPDASADAGAQRPDAGRDAGPVGPRCGDGIIDRPEVCDDGNTSSGDGCRADCLSVECSGARTYEDPVTHHCYWRETSVVSRTEAVTRCTNQRGYLIRWASTAERDAAYPSVLGSVSGRVWIGLTRVSSVWTWDDGTPSSTSGTDFRAGEPSGDGPCVEWGPASSLNDIPCSQTRDYVCEREPAGTQR